MQWLQGSSCTRELMEESGCCRQELVLTVEGWSDLVLIAQFPPEKLAVCGLPQRE